MGRSGGQNPVIPDEATTAVKRRVMSTCGICLVTLRAPFRHPEIDAFIDRHKPHGQGFTAVNQAHSNVWSEGDEVIRLKAEVTHLNAKVASQKQEIARLLERGDGPHQV